MPDRQPRLPSSPPAFAAFARPSTTSWRLSPSKSYAATADSEARCGIRAAEQEHGGDRRDDRSGGQAGEERPAATARLGRGLRRLGLRWLRRRSGVGSGSGPAPAPAPAPAAGPPLLLRRRAPECGQRGRRDAAAVVVREPLERIARAAASAAGAGRRAAARARSRRPRGSRPGCSRRRHASSGGSSGRRSCARSRYRRGCRRPCRVSGSASARARAGRRSRRGRRPRCGRPRRRPRHRSAGPRRRCGEQRAGGGRLELVDAGRRSASSNAYSSSVDAVSITLPRPSKRCSTSTDSALFGTAPCRTRRCGSSRARARSSARGSAASRR